MGSSAKTGSLLLVLFTRGAVLYWGPQDGTLIERTTQMSGPQESVLDTYCWVIRSLGCGPPQNQSFQRVLSSSLWGIRSQTVLVIPTMEKVLSTT